jgi:hypothetical protein
MDGLARASMEIGDISCEFAWQVQKDLQGEA